MNLPTLSVQLYTVRDALRDDLPATLARVAEIGYRTVELFDFVTLADQYGPALDTLGLAAPTAHARLSDADVPAIFAAARSLGVGTVIDPRIAPERWTTASDVADVAAQMNSVVDLAASYGLAVGYHNHAEEFAYDIDGVSAFEYFAALLDERVHLEVDTYWAAVAGQDPVALLRRLGAQVRYLHVKDGPISAVKEDQLPVGRGLMDVRGILTAAPQAMRVVELDDYSGDVFVALEESFRFLTA